MPGFLLDVTSTVICLHAGQATPTAPNPRVLVGGNPTVTLAAPYVVAGCALASSGGPFCVTAQWVLGATRVFSGGQPLLLQDSQAVCAATGTGLQPVVVQPRVSGQ
jgi:hypothetical protein